MRGTILNFRDITHNSIDLKWYENIDRKLELSSSLYGSEDGLLSYHVNKRDTEIFSTKTYRKLV